MNREFISEQDVDLFRKLFSQYCKGEIAAERCEEDSCELCSVNRAYEEIFEDNGALEEDE